MLPVTSSSEQDWDNHEIDEETLEDIEISLYGMLHHAPNEDNCDNMESGTPICESSYPPESSEGIQYGENNSSILHEVEETKENNVIDSKAQFSNSNSTPAAQPTSSKSLVSNNCKAILKKQKEVSSQSIKRNYNPFSEYIVVEHYESEAVERGRRKEGTKTCNIIDISSDEEDSRYICIDKSSKLVMSSKIKRKDSEALDCSSDSDSSVIILDARKEKESIRSPSTDSYSDSYSDPDSDSEIEILEKGNVSKKSKDLKLNISGTIDTAAELDIPSQSEDWKKYSCQKWTSEMIEFYDKDGQGINLQAVADSLPRNVNWFVDDDDRFGEMTNLQRNRYFGKKSRIRCLNCKQPGHVARDCGEPKKVLSCQVCGMPGHTPFQCPSKVCFGCGRPSKIYIECCPECRRERNAICMICNLNHLTQQCPDLWRRYHLTIEGNELKSSAVSLKPDHLQHCYNCAGIGHLPLNCKSNRSSKYPIPHPVVFRYQDPKKFLDQLTDGGKNSVVVKDPKSIWVVGAPPGVGRLIKYSFSSSSGITGKMIESVKFEVLKEVKNVDITWRRQAKKGRYFVEFSGHGDTIMARNLFKKRLSFKKKSSGERSKAPPSLTSPKQLPSSSLVDPALVKAVPKTANKALANGSVNAKAGHKGATDILAVTVVHKIPNNKHVRRKLKLHLTPKEKTLVGKMLGKLELKYRVVITSSFLKNEWEIYVTQRKDGEFSPSSCSAASNSIINYLHSL